MPKGTRRVDCYHGTKSKACRFPTDLPTLISQPDPFRTARSKSSEGSLPCIPRAWIRDLHGLLSYKLLALPMLAIDGTVGRGWEVWEICGTNKPTTNTHRYTTRNHRHVVTTDEGRKTENVANIRPDPIQLKLEPKIPCLVGHPLQERIGRKMTAFEVALKKKKSASSWRRKRRGALREERERRNIPRTAPMIILAFVASLMRRRSLQSPWNRKEAAPSCRQSTATFRQAARSLG